MMGVINEDTNNSQLVKDFLNHYYNGGDLNIDNIPKELINKFPNFKVDFENIPKDWNSPTLPITYVTKLSDDSYLYSGVEKGRKIESIRSWTIDEETADVFSQKYEDGENGEVIQLSYKDFVNTFEYFVSMDVIFDYIYRNNLNNEETEDYVSEGEIVILKK